MANINKSLKEIDLMIESEYNKAKKAIALKKELEALNEEEARLKEELGLENIDEVEIGGRKSGSEWYQKDVPVSKFEKIGSHLKEMEGLEDMDTEEVAGYFEEKLAELGRELDTKLSGEDMGAEEDMEDKEDMGAEDDMEDMGDEDDMDDMGSEDDMEDMGSEDDMIDEKEDNSDAPDVLEIDANGIIDDEEETVDEQAGESLISKADKKIKGDDGMTKVDNKNPMADKMYEGEEDEDLNESAKSNKKLVTETKETDSSVLMEGLSDREQAKLKEELARMKSLMSRR